jgi:hypothetical protein
MALVTISKLSEPAAPFHHGSRQMSSGGNVIVFAVRAR